MKTWLASIAPISLALLAACPSHHGSLGQAHANDIILSKEGIASFVGSPNRCPGPNPDGEIKLTYDNGKNRVKGECRGGVMVGGWKAWYDNGAVVWEASFNKGGLLDGELTSYYANDQKMARVGYREGVPEGKFDAWWFNGKKRIEGEFVGGKKNGCWETWHENGQKASKGTYADDRQVLTWLNWTPSGQKSKQSLGGEAAHGSCLITI
jgi:antitoxin component YwqK of YwqJK toxin-antitoxin module